MNASKAERTRLRVLDSVTHVLSVSGYEVEGDGGQVSSDAGHPTVGSDIV